MAQRPGLDSHRGPSAYAGAGDCAVAGHASARMRCAKGGGVVAAPAAAPGAEPDRADDSAVARVSLSAKGLERPQRPVSPLFRPTP
ncbi:hypothetical protein ABTB07_21735, partial [Acinetobacter baumannii]